MASLKGLGAALRALRTKRGLTQAQAAARCERIGASDISRWEGDASPNVETERLERYLDGLGATLMELARLLEREQGGGGVDGAVERYAEVRRDTLERLVEDLEGRVSRLESGGGKVPSE
jgi:transcriptional regulator with XRE-family HTH domain